MVNFMLLTLYKTLDGDNVINKTLEEPTDFNINLKGEVDINNPDLLMVRLTGLDYNDYNYAYLPDFERYYFCLLYTSDAADERSSVDLGGRRITKKKRKSQG